MNSVAGMIIQVVVNVLTTAGGLVFVVVAEIHILKQKSLA